jgi:hypothetical protein
MRRLVSFVALVLSAPTPSLAGEAHVPDASGRPQLELRVTPPAAFSPATVLVVARLVGGRDLEGFYCPEVEWDFGDGGRSTREGDCPPFGDDTKMARLYSLRYRYSGAGEYQIRLTLRRAGRTVVSASVPIKVIGRGSDEPIPQTGPAADLARFHR